MSNTLDFDLEAVPFSRFGSYMAFSWLAGEKHESKGFASGLWLRSVHGDGGYELMRVELVDSGKSVPYKITRTASALTLQSAGGSVDVCFPTATTIRCRARGVGLRLSAHTFRNHGAIPDADGAWMFNMASAFRSYRLVPLSGRFSVDAPWTTKRCEHMIADLSPADGQVAELAIEELTWMRPALEHPASFDAIVDEVQAEFEAFCEPFLNGPDSLQTTVIEAAYVNWSSVVHPHRLLKRPAMYMSKNWMTNVWAWDHAFNALATSLTDPDLGWDQLMVIFDHQDESGQIPDFVNDVKFLTVFVKPPIHGWILSRILEYSGELPPDRLAQAYDMLTRWTEWWFTYRTPDQDGLPVYWHGNDSGWDNGTVFDTTLPLKAPDLAAFLVVQMDTIADLADQLGRTEEANGWRERAQVTLDNLIEKLWDGNRFKSISAVTGETASPSDSVFGCLPIILGNRLPQPIIDALATEIRRHLTDWGPATEHPDSRAYDANGYWRGPIWAPPTLILIDGLHAAGETALAQDIAERFTRLCAKSGFAENFNAITGTSQRDLAYTWTSSVFLILANKYL